MKLFVELNRVAFNFNLECKTNFHKFGSNQFWK